MYNEKKGLYMDIKEAIKETNNKYGKALEKLSSDEMDMEFSTLDLEDKESRCESIEELKEEIIPLLKTQSEQWREKIGDIFNGSGLTKTDFAKKCGISRVMLDKWLEGAIPNSRERFIRIGLVAGYGKDEINRLLQRYGGYPGLYAKSLEDAVCFFVIEHAESLTAEGGSLYDIYEDILGEIRSRILSEDDGPAEDLATTTLERKLSEVGDKDELAVFVDRYSAVFAMSFKKLYSYILVNLEANKDDYLNTSTSAMAEAQGWSSSLRQCISAIKQNKWYPTRNKIISIGFHLSMDYDQINEMLDIAHMEHLCAKNIFESVVIYVLNDAELNLGLEKGEDGYDPTGLCDYAYKIMADLDIPEITDFISEIRIPDPEAER